MTQQIRVTNYGADGSIEYMCVENARDIEMPFLLDTTKEWFRDSIPIDGRIELEAI